MRARRPIKFLGKGSFGAVILVKKVTGQSKGALYAMKIITKRSLENRCLRETARVLSPRRESGFPRRKKSKTQILSILSSLHVASEEEKKARPPLLV